MTKTVQPLRPTTLASTKPRTSARSPTVPATARAPGKSRADSTEWRNSVRGSCFPSTQLPRAAHRRPARRSRPRPACHSAQGLGDRLRAHRHAPGDGQERSFKINPHAHQRASPAVPNTTAERMNRRRATLRLRGEFMYAAPALAAAVGSAVTNPVAPAITSGPAPTR